MPTSSRRPRARLLSGGPRRLIAVLAAVIAALGLMLVVPATTSAAPQAENPLPENGWTASSNTNSPAGDAPANAIDGNINTRFSSGAVQAPGMYFQVNMGSSQTFNQIELNAGPSTTDYAAGYNVEVSTNGSTFTSVATGTGTASPQIIAFTTQTAQYIRVVLTASTQTPWWSIAEFTVYTSGSSTGTENPLPENGWTASSNTSPPAGDAPANAIDGNINTRFSSDAVQAPGMYFQVNMGSTQNFNQIELNAGPSTTDYAAGYNVEVSTDGSTFTSVATGTGTASPQIITFGAQNAQYLRVVLTASTQTPWWSIAEFTVFTTGAVNPPPPTGGEPPTSFWGDTGSIPAAHNVLELKIINQTNGQYPDSQVYWSFNGQTQSIAQQPYIDMPANSAGRMYFYLGSPNGQYYDFIEFTVGPSSINVDTTRVDRFGLKLAMLLHGHDGSNQEVGENYATFQESRTATFQRFQNSVPSQFSELATDQAPYGIPSPGNDPAFQPGGAYANYFTSYAASVGDTSDSTAQIFGCGGTLSANPNLCAGLNRHVAQLPAAQQSNPANFYQAAPANYYAQFWHQNAINGMQYGFPYDDDAGQSSDISEPNPQYMVVAVGW
ncbi:MAG TPA: discoidin domain-containing protein [Pseudonocardiaceae bacterium]